MVHSGVLREGLLHIYVLPLVICLPATLCAAQHTSDGRSETCVAQADIDALREYSDKSFAIVGGRHEEFGLRVPLEIAPRVVTGGIPLIDVDLGDSKRREDAYTEVLTEVLLMADADIEEMASFLDEVAVAAGATGDSLGQVQTIGDLYVWLCRPAVRNTYAKHVRLRALPKWMKGCLGPLDAGAKALNVTSDFLHVAALLSINEAAVRARAKTIERLIRQHSQSDPPLRAAIERAEAKAVAAASSITAAVGSMLRDKHGGPKGLTDGAALIGYLAGKLRVVAPRGYKTALRGLSSKVAATMSRWSPHLLALEILYNDGVVVRSNVERAAIAATLMYSIFLNDHIEAATSDPLGRAQAYSCAAYCAYTAASRMEGLLSNGVKLAEGELNVVQLVRDMLMKALHGKEHEYLKQRESFHGLHKEAFLRFAGDIERCIITTPMPLPPAEVEIETRPEGARAFVEGQGISGAVTPLTYSLPSTITDRGQVEVAVERAGYQRATRTVAVWPGETTKVEFDLTPLDSGMLDCVLCIDKSGSMADEIKMVQDMSSAMLAKLDEFAKAQEFSLRVGLVTYTRHDDPDWIHAWELTADVDEIRGNLLQIKITDVGLGKGGNEDLYGAMVYAMDQTVGGRSIQMGWRPGAAKIIIPIGDEPADDPDWEERTLADVARVARNLDPVHIYPVILPKQGPSFLDPAVRSMERIAEATGGKVIRVKQAGDLPNALVETVKLAVRRHRNEVWRKAHPPYLLYGTLGVLLGLTVLVLVVFSIRALVRRPARCTGDR